MQEREDPCRRCKHAPATLTVRGEKLCNGCLERWVATKTLKRLEASRVRGTYGEPARQILVPISLGLSSICLLHLLHLHLRERKAFGRQPGFELRLLHVDLTSIGVSSPPQEKLNLIQARFSDYSLRVIRLEQCFDYGVSVDCLSGLGSSVDRLRAILASTSSLTSEVDVIELLLRRLINAFARSTNCHSVLYGDSTTRLAERTLAETAKGRGGSVPKMTTDHHDADLQICYPLRDLLRTELHAYATIQVPRLDDIIHIEDQTIPSISSKNISIDALMRQYCARVEIPYPSIVANVVRTTSKLHSQDSLHRICDCCAQPIVWNDWVGDQQGAEQVPSTNAALCYGCVRSLNVTSPSDD